MLSKLTGVSSLRRGGLDEMRRRRRRENEDVVGHLHSLYRCGVVSSCCTVAASTQPQKQLLSVSSPGGLSYVYKLCNESSVPLYESSNLGGGMPHRRTQAEKEEASGWMKSTSLMVSDAASSFATLWYGLGSTTSVAIKGT